MACLVLRTDCHSCGSLLTVRRRILQVAQVHCRPKVHSHCVTTFHFKTQLKNLRLYIWSCRKKWRCLYNLIDIVYSIQTEALKVSVTAVSLQYFTVSHDFFLCSWHIWNSLLFKTSKQSSVCCYTKLALIFMWQFTMYHCNTEKLEVLTECWEKLNCVRKWDIIKAVTGAVII
jgi:hypothetical protein